MKDLIKIGSHVLIPNNPKTTTFGIVKEIKEGQCKIDISRYNKRKYCIWRPLTSLTKAHSSPLQITRTLTFRDV